MGSESVNASSKHGKSCKLKTSVITASCKETDVTDKILIDRSVVEQALKALEKADRISGYRNNWAEVNSLIAALAQPQGEQEPVGEAGSMPGTDGFTMACFRASDVPVGTKLYTHPQPQREPLTEADLYDIAGNYFADEWAQKQAVMMLKDHGIGDEK
jgi:hypothetical protein